MLLSNQAVYPCRTQCLLAAAGFQVKLVTGVMNSVDTDGDIECLWKRIFDKD